MTTIEKQKRDRNETTMHSSEDPDVIIAVGGQEFREYRQTLRCWSGFFDAAFRSGMKESETGRFEFADKDPKEWELVSSLVSPLSECKVTEDNVQIVLPWFDHLHCERGLKQCDMALLSLLDTAVSVAGEDAIDSILDLLSTSIQCNLTATKSQCLSKIKAALTEDAHFLAVDHLKHVSSFMMSDDICKSELWGALGKHLPEALLTFDQESILLQDLFPFLVHSEINRVHRLSQVGSQLDKTKSQLEKTNSQLDKTKSQLDKTESQFESELESLSYCQAKLGDVKR